ncbi:type II toxin-antitoxin system CcdA family antitoxin [Phenylobacterium aquaticum]|uniref:type II toxin-antitoxin system CcdA family antitoxin n=1 Tax=Phenylobacterium aquaticum TaxID=1763816 RepID=UPI0026E9E242|nr:type II toxin-antitoxin system CcdA family antitoxin [Phenylobacterium aquaticum]
MGKTELKIDADLLAQAEAAGVLTERVVERALREALLAASGPAATAAAADARAAKWAEENAEAIADYNRRIRERGVFSTGLRTW